MNTELDPMWNIPDDLRPRVHRFTTALDNYNPTRDYAYGELVAYDILTDETRQTTGYKIESHHFGKDPEKNLYLIDFGNVIVPCYVVTWNQRTVTVHPMPTSQNNTFYNWSLGPKKTYHLKIRK